MKLNKKETIKFAGFALLILALFVTGHALHLVEKVSVDSLRESLSRTGGWQYLIFFVIYCVAALLPFPTAVLSTASGALWGAYLGTGITVFSATLASCLPFMLARLMARNAVRNVVEKSKGASRCDRFAGKNGFITVLIMRLIPFFPWDMVNYLSGLCSIRFRDYLLASLLGTIPASFTYNLIGASMGGSVNKIAVVVAGTVTVILAVVILIIKMRSGSKEYP
jgi:uncharacterized membrane protein YdjX (TVP38/TMEM64 family)